MAWIWTAIALGIKLLGLVDKAGQVYHDWQERQKGRLAQRQIELEATKKEAIDAKVNEETSGALSDAALDDALRKRMQPPA